MADVRLPEGRRSPLQHRAGDLARAGKAGHEGVAVREVPFLTQFNLRLWSPDPEEEPLPVLTFPLPLALPRTPNTVTRAGHRAACWLGPNEWLIVTPEDTAPEVEDVLRPAVGEAQAGSVTDVSAHRTVLELSGGLARQVLRKVCSIDLHPRAFRPGSCAQTLLAQVPVLLVTSRETETFELFVRASFAEYVAEWLLDAMSEYENNGVNRMKGASHDA